MNSEDLEVNDPMEEDDNNNIVEDDGTNRLIQDTFSQMDYDNFHDIYDKPLLDKEKQPLYEGLRENILSATLLLMNLNVLNGFPNNCMT